MGLLDLPPELLDAIINYAGPAGIESFVLSCKAVHVRAASQIQQHNALKRRWTSTTLSRPTALHGDALHLLYDISQDPLTAQYVEVLSLWDRRLEESIDPDNVEDFRTNEQGMAEIKKTVMENRYLQLANVDLEDWWDHIVSEGPDDIFYIVITLLSLLPNLKTLQLPPGRWGNFNPYEFSEEPERTLVSVLDTIVSQAHPTGYSGPPLSKLEKILPFTPEGYDMRAGLQSLEPFMVLDSIREIYASSCVAVDDSYTGIPFQWRHGHQPSPITKLELAHCCIDAEGLEALVAHTPALHTFRYSHQTKWHGCQHDWNPGAFLSTLGKYCGPNINHLAVTIDELLGEIINGMSTFFAFPALQTLEVDVRVFCGPPLESGQQLGLPDPGVPHDRQQAPLPGTAAYRRQPVYVEDIATDPLWADFKQLAAAHGLGACGSTPILARDGRLLGTVAIYHSGRHIWNAQDQRLVETATRTAASNGNGLGSRLVESFVRQLGGRHEVVSSANGTTHRLLIPSLD